MDREFDVVNEIKIRVRYEETDQMGFVYYGNYFTWFEVGRCELLRELGLAYAAIEERGIILPVTDADCRYKSSARYDELVTVRTTVNKLTPARINFAYQIVSEEGRVIAYGNTCHAFVDKSGRPVNVSKKDPDLWNRLLSLLGGAGNPE